MSGPGSTTSTPPRIDAGSRPRSRAAFLASRGWISAIIAALVGAALCFFVLAPWQFNRNAERAAENARIVATATADPVPLDDVLPAGAQATDQLAFRPVTATGTFLAGQVAVGLRQNQASQPSIEVLSPFQLSDGSILLMDRGYLSANTYNGSIPLPQPPSGTVTVTARVQPYQPDPLQRPAIQRDGYLEVRGIEATSVPGLPGVVRGGFVQLTETSPGVLGAIGVPQVDSGPFLSYAWQWITFGTMALLALGFFIHREFVDPRDGLTDEDDADPDRSDSGSGGSDGVGGSPAPQFAPAGRTPRAGRFDRSRLYDS